MHCSLWAFGHCINFSGKKITTPPHKCGGACMPNNNHNNKLLSKIFYDENCWWPECKHHNLDFRRKFSKSFFYIFQTKTFQESFDAAHTLIACVREYKHHLGAVVINDTDAQNFSRLLCNCSNSQHLIYQLSIWLTVTVKLVFWSAQVVWIFIHTTNLSQIKKGLMPLFLQSIIIH